MNTTQISRTKIHNSVIPLLKLKNIIKIKNYFMMKMKTIRRSLLIFIIPIGNHKMIKRPKNIQINWKMIILMMILKIKILNFIKQSQEYTYSLDN